jgi:hypothetical protein
MNVYYLPARQTQTATPETSLTASRWSVLKARGHRTWWRLRLTAIDVWGALRRGMQRHHPIEKHIWFADDAPAPRRRALGPARIIDLDAARRRRVPAALTARA